MMMHVKTTANGRVCAVSAQYMGDGDQLVTWPDGVSLDDHRDYKVVDGVLVHDPEPEPEVIPAPTLGERVAAVEAGQETQDTAIDELVQVMADMIGGAV